MKFRAIYSSRYNAILLLAGIFLFHAFNNLLWLRMDFTPLHDHLGYHLSAALSIADSSGNIVGLLINGLTYHVINFYPALFHTVMAVSAFIAGRSTVVLIMGNMPFLLLLLVSLYGIGRKMRNPGIGLLAGFILTMYPAIFDLSRFSLPDFALTAMLAAGVCLLMYSEGFSNRRYSLLFGVCLGLGMLTKQIFILFILPPLITVILNEIIEKRGIEEQVIKNIMTAFFIGLVISIYWYIPPLKQLLQQYVQAGFHEKGTICSPDIFGADSLMFYIRKLYQCQMLMYLFIIFLVGARYWLVTKEHGREKILFFASIIGTYLLFLFIYTKEPKTTLPWLIYFALITAAGLLSLRKAWVRTVAICLLVCFSVIQYMEISFSCQFQKPIVDFLHQQYRYPGFSLFRAMGSFKPSDYNRAFSDILVSMSPVQDRQTRVGVFTETMSAGHSMGNCIANFDAFFAAAQLNKWPYQVINPLTVRTPVDYFITPGDKGALSPGNDLLTFTFDLKTLRKFDVDEDRIVGEVLEKNGATLNKLTSLTQSQLIAAVNDLMNMPNLLSVLAANQGLADVLPGKADNRMRRANKQKLIAVFGRHNLTITDTLKDYILKKTLVFPDGSIVSIYQYKHLLLSKKLSASSRR